jgi:hypothetical protein
MSKCFIVDSVNINVSFVGVDNHWRGNRHVYDVSIVTDANSFSARYFDYSSDFKKGKYHENLLVSTLKYLFYLYHDSYETSSELHKVVTDDWVDGINVYVKLATV